MDKEAQLKEIAEVVDKYHIGCGLPIECNSECDVCAAKALWDSGYRKLPQDKPRLLDSLELEKLLGEPRSLILCEDAAQAQWDICVKHYETD